MPALLENSTSASDLELLTFRIGGLLIGVDIRHVNAINSRLTVTRAPHADDFVLGVMNLRSDVITVLDFGRLLRLTNGVAGNSPQGVIVNFEGERVALAVDYVADVVTVPGRKVGPLPPNFRRQDERAFQGVHTLDEELVFILDLAEALGTRRPK